MSVAERFQIGAYGLIVSPRFLRDGCISYEDVCSRVFRRRLINSFDEGDVARFCVSRLRMEAVFCVVDERSLFVVNRGVYRHQGV